MDNTQQMCHALFDFIGTPWYKMYRVLQNKLALIFKHRVTYISREMASVQNKVFVYYFIGKRYLISELYH
jgi:hypothetical protein